MTFATKTKATWRATAAAEPTMSPADGAPAAAFFPPPGLSLPEPAVCDVHVKGVPDKLLTPVLVEAILHQAALFDDDVVGFSISRTCRPSLSISFSSDLAAQQCAEYFRGCQWGESLEAEVVMLETPEAMAAKAARREAASLQDCGAVAFQQDSCVAPMSEGDSTDTPSEGFVSSLSADAPPWEPACHAYGTTRLTSAAPAFVPAALNKQSYEIRVASPRKAGRRQDDASNAYVSETSTEVGESEDESQGASPVSAQ